MSSALAIAAVTYVLKDLLNDGLINHNVSDAVSGNVTVTVLPPDLVLDPSADKGTKLNLFMYQATSNQGWRNSGLPSRDSRGDRINSPPLALDLHYLLTAYASEEFHSEILLGYGMLLLHENPVIAREVISNSLTTVSASGSGLPDKLKSLADSGLADQIEQIKITPQPVNIDEMSKLWSAFQSKYRPTATYQVSVVLLESKIAARSSLPVLRRGRPEAFANGAEGIVVTPDLLKPLTLYPTLDRVIYPDRQQNACLGDSVTISGINLEGSDVVVTLENRWVKNEIDIGNVSSGMLTFQLPADKPAEWVPGFYNVSAMIRRPGKSFLEVTNQVVFSLAPHIKPAPAITSAQNPKRADLCDVTITIQSTPFVRPEQRVSLFLNDTEALPQPFDNASGEMQFVFKALPPGDYLVRLRVDGVDSHFIDYTTKPPEFMAGSKVTIP
jgi:hypothetical protein